MRHTVLRQPIGVAAFFAINFPMRSPTRKVAGALPASCAIILKGIRGDARRGSAAGARLPERRRAARCAQSGIGQDGVGGLAAKLLYHTFDRICGSLGDQDAGQAGERNHVDMAMAGYRLAGRRPIAIHKVEDTFGVRRPVKNLSEDDPAQRRNLARLQDHRATGGERWRKLRCDLVERPVPLRRHTPIGCRRMRVSPMTRTNLYDFKTEVICLK
jgi:hypothetical protein